MAEATDLLPTQVDVPQFMLNSVRQPEERKVRKPQRRQQVARGRYAESDDDAFSEAYNDLENDAWDVLHQKESKHVREFWRNGLIDNLRVKSGTSLKLPTAEYQLKAVMRGLDNQRYLTAQSSRPCSRPILLIHLPIPPELWGACMRECVRACVRGGGRGGFEIAFSAGGAGVVGASHCG